MENDNNASLKLHIAVLIQDFPPETGAGPARVSELAADWIAAGHRVSVLTAFPSRRIPGQRDGEVPEGYRRRLSMHELLGGIDVYRSWLFTSRDRRFTKTLVNHLSFALSSLLNGLVHLSKPDILIASGPPYFAQFSGALLARRYAIPLILEIRDLWPDYLVEMGVIRVGFLRRAMFASERWLLRRASRVVVVTESFYARVVDKGVLPRAISVIPNGVDPDRYYPDSQHSSLPGFMRRDGERVVGYLGTFGAGQGLKTLIEAARRLERMGRPVRLLLVGDGPDRAALEADLRDNPALSVSIHSPIHRDDTRAFYGSCDLIVVPHAALPVLADTVPSKIFEVMACARPLVAVLRGEGARIVEASGGGILATPGDPESIAVAIDQVLTMSAASREAMGASGRRYALTHYDRHALARAYLNLLRETVTLEQPRPAPLS